MADVIRAPHEYRCELTKELDEHLLPKWKEHNDLAGGSYFYIEKTQRKFKLKADDNLFYILFRYPGATRGIVVIDRDTGIIKHFKFDSTAYMDRGVACYSPSVETVCDHWMGKALPELLELIKSLPVK